MHTPHGRSEEVREVRKFATPLPPTRKAPRSRQPTEPAFTKAECVVGLECRFRRTNGTIVEVHETDNGMQLYRFKSDTLYVLATRAELKRTKETPT